MMDKITVFEEMRWGSIFDIIQWYSIRNKSTLTVGLCVFFLQTHFLSMFTLKYETFKSEYK
jgi:hypothetical protein